MTTAPVAIDRPPCEVLACLAGEPGAFLLDVPDPQRPVTLVGCAPTAELRVEANATDPLGTIARFVDEMPLRADDLPFPLAGGVLACFAYELGAHTVPGPRGAGPDAVAAVRTTAAPLAVLRRYDPLLVYDRRRGTWSLIGGAPERARWLHRLATPSTPWRGPLATRELVPGFDRDAYRTAIARIHAYLHAGDAYQVNLTQPFTVPLDGPAWALFARLATQHPAAYGAYVDLGDRQVVVNSPELLVRRRGTHVETRPIKGTRPRGSDPARDAALVAELCADPKERAEHVMIVDLERNDLGRLCETGSIRVEAHAAVESHPTLHHLVSIVAGRLRPEIGWRELLTATFPGGSVTGAPKRRAMEIIAELEPGPRGFYTGGVGLLDSRGHCEIGLPIRTGVVEGGVLRYHAGGGIVVDSDPDRELDECWLKTAAVRAALAGDTSALDRCSSG
jgi:para-aminobenzoate synthetase component 1